MFNHWAISARKYSSLRPISKQITNIPILNLSEQNKIHNALNNCSISRSSYCSHIRRNSSFTSYETFSNIYKYNLVLETAYCNVRLKSFSISGSSLMYDDSFRISSSMIVECSSIQSPRS